VRQRQQDPLLLPDHLVTRGLDRLSARRRDPDWLAARMTDAGTRFVPVLDGQNLFAPNGPTPAYLAPDQVSELVAARPPIVLLGQVGKTVCFAVGIRSTDALPAEHGRFQPLRQTAALLSEQDCALLALAKAMIEWHARHRFCGDCGSPTESREAGHILVCTNKRCGVEHFPRTDPAIIVLVTHADRCLLGRKTGWPKGMHSAIAGFVEPGESLEQTVAREVKEETGLDIEQIRYHASQPWPFPRSLMLGFYARAATTEIVVDEFELETARWFTREKICEGLRNSSFALPSSISIARRLIRDWFDQGERGHLETQVSGFVPSST